MVQNASNNEEEEKRDGERATLLEMSQGSPITKVLWDGSQLRDKILDLLADVRVPGRPPEPFRR